VSDTPETDLVLDNQLHDCVPFDDSAEQLAELCRKLERERDAARNLADAAIWESDRFRRKLWRSCDREEKLVCERNKALQSCDEALALLKAHLLTDQ